MSMPMLTAVPAPGTVEAAPEATSIPAPLKSPHTAFHPPKTSPVASPTPGTFLAADLAVNLTMAALISFLTAFLTIFFWYFLNLSANMSVTLVTSQFSSFYLSSSAWVFLTALLTTFLVFLTCFCSCFKFLLILPNNYILRKSQFAQKEQIIITRIRARKHFHNNTKVAFKKRCLVKVESDRKGSFQYFYFRKTLTIKKQLDYKQQKLTWLTTKDLPSLNSHITKSSMKKTQILMIFISSMVIQSLIKKQSVYSTSDTTINQFYH